MTAIAFLDAFNTSHLAEDLRGAWNDAAMSALVSLGNAGFDVTVSTDLYDLAAFWADHRGQPQLREFPNFDVHYWPSASKSNTLLCFLERDGRKVGACGYRLIELFDKRQMRPLTLKEAFDERFFFYEQPDMGPANECCHLRPHSSEWICDCVVCVAGALWIEKQHRGMDLFKSFGKLSRLLAVTAQSFSYSYMVVMFCPDNRELAMDHFGFSEYVPHACSFRGEEWWVAWSTRADAIRLALQ